MSDMINDILMTFGLESNELNINALLCIFFFVLSFEFVSELIRCLWGWFKK